MKTFWFTGLPCSGKTTVADIVAEESKSYKSIKVVRLDGDVVRKGLCKDLGFSKEDRRINLERIGYICKLLNDNDIIVLATFVSPYKDIRQWLKDTIGDEQFVEVFCKCSVEECIKRDVKGMYAKAIKGEIKNFTGVSDPFEDPESPEIILDTEFGNADNCGREILERILYYK